MTSVSIHNIQSITFDTPQEMTMTGAGAYRHIIIVAEDESGSRLRYEMTLFASDIKALNISL